MHAPRAGSRGAARLRQVDEALLVRRRPYIPDAADHDAAWKVAARFRELRADEFTGGFVLRRYGQFTSAEARTWWVGGTCRLVTAHPDTPGDLPPDTGLAPFTPLIGSLELPFVTADLALRADGTWRAVEVGDGQVSDRPPTTNPAAFLNAILGPWHTSKRAMTTRSQLPDTTGP